MTTYYSKYLEHLQNGFTRRDFIRCSSAATAALALSSTVPGLLTPAYAAPNLFTLTRLTPARLLSALFFNVVMGVVTELATDYIVQKLRENHYAPGVAQQTFGGSIGTSLLSTLTSAPEVDFTPPPYKASVICLGLADYRVPDEEPVIKVELMNNEDSRRSREVVRYLQKEKVKLRVAKPGIEFSSPADELHLEADDLLSVVHWQFPGHPEQHLARLLDVTGTTAFNGLDNDLLPQA